MRFQLSVAVGLVLLSVAGGVSAQPKLVRKTVSVEVVAASDADQDAAAQVRKIAVDTFENYRNLLVRRYLADKDLKAHELLQQTVTEANRKVQTGMRSEVFDQGLNDLNQAYFKAKELLGEVDPALLSAIYRGLFMAQTTMGDSLLAAEYLTVLLNLDASVTRQSLSYTESFVKVYDAAEEARKPAGRKKVSVTADPAGAMVRVDGSAWGRSPVEVDLAAGGHLVQAELDGYYRAGWIRDPALHGTAWKMQLKPIESLERYRGLLAKLQGCLGPAPAAGDKPLPRPKKGAPPPAPPDPAALMNSLHALLASDYLLVVVVSGAGGSMTLKGGFVTAWGIVPMDFSAARSLTIIDEVRKQLLDASDVEKQKKDYAAAELDKARHEVTEGLRSLLDDMDFGQRELMTRARRWDLLGEKQKSELFATTAADVSAMLEEARQIGRDGEQDLRQTAKTVTAMREKWDPLHTKVRSLLSWDIDAAEHARKVGAMQSLDTHSSKGLDETRALATAKSAALDKAEARDLARTLKDMDRWLADARKKLKKDPLSVEAKVVYYRLLIVEAELKRKLSQK